MTHSMTTTDIRTEIATVLAHQGEIEGLQEQILELASKITETRSVIRSKSIVIRGALRAKAYTLADNTESRSSNGTVEIAEWVDEAGRRRTIVVAGSEPRDVVSVTYLTKAGPSNRTRRTQNLMTTPFEHLEEHFGPLMT